jgi:hypothetical protein
MEKMNKCKNVGYVKACYEICLHSDQHDMIRECNCGCSICIPVPQEVKATVKENLTVQSILLSESERAKVNIPCELVCGQAYPDTLSAFCLDCIADKFCKAQAKKVLERMLELEKLEGNLTVFHCEDGRLSFRKFIEAIKKEVEG